MLIQLGQRQRKDDDLPGILLACHERIRTFLDLARALATRDDASTGERLEASARVVRYFTEALPLHAEYEEKSIEPRLRGRSAWLDAALDRMLAEHAEHEEPLRRMLALCPQAAAPDGARARGDLLLAVEALREHFEKHLASEELIVFPALRGLSAREQAAILDELRSRRTLG